ncbi:MAG TPA: type IV toxin-antitoxin system AbiEi family antitoxin domain-containing protein [Solirubrobacterales bacterium]|nr:type IV toxin-antitoxin system AbiEi family antitoxin domain-containing protein [Solirubrobacterales bacterium]
MPGKGRTPRSFGPLREVATRQHGVVSMGQLLGLGHSAAAVLEWAKVGRLHRVHRGVYAVGHRRLSWYSHCWAAVLAAEPDEGAPWRAVASHYTAAYLWGLLRWRPDAMHVTAPTRRRAERRFVVHFSSILAEEDRTVREGIPVTAVPRVLLDLSIRSRPDRIEGYLERAEERDLLDVRAVEDVLARAGGHRGRGPLARALAIYRPDPSFTRSKFEARFRRLVEAAGLPAPSMNFNVAGFELDAHWPDLRFAVELDLFETHGSRAAFERDRRRQEELKLHGIEMIRITAPRLKREPQAVIRNLATLLERRQHELRRP